MQVNKVVLYRPIPFEVVACQRRIRIEGQVSVRLSSV